MKTPNRYTTRAAASLLDQEIQLQEVETYETTDGSLICLTFDEREEADGDYSIEISNGKLTPEHFASLLAHLQRNNLLESKEAAEPAEATYPAQTVQDAIQDAIQDSDHVTSAARALIDQAEGNHARAAVRWFYLNKAANGICLTNDEADEASRADGELARAMDSETLDKWDFDRLLNHCFASGAFDEEPEAQPERQALAITAQERNTILAALRHYFISGLADNPSKRSALIHDIATNCDADISLDGEGLNDLCERINTAPELILPAEQNTVPAAKSDLEQFAVTVLRMMEHTEEWDADMVDKFDVEAARLNLSTHDGDGYFRANLNR